VYNFIKIRVDSAADFLPYSVVVVRVIESILGQLLSIVKDETVPSEVSQLAFQLLHLITKVPDVILLQNVKRLIFSL